MASRGRGGSNPPPGANLPVMAVFELILFKTEVFENLSTIDLLFIESWKKQTTSLTPKRGRESYLKSKTHSRFVLETFSAC